MKFHLIIATTIFVHCSSTMQKMPGSSAPILNVQVSQPIQVKDFAEGLFSYKYGSVDAVATHEKINPKQAMEIAEEFLRKNYLPQVLAMVQLHSYYFLDGKYSFFFEQVFDGLPLQSTRATLHVSGNKVTYANIPFVEIDSVSEKQNLTQNKLLEKYFDAARNRNFSIKGMRRVYAYYPKDNFPKDKKYFLRPNWKIEFDSGELMVDAINGTIWRND